MDCLIIDLTDEPGHWGKIMLADLAAALAGHGVDVTTILDDAGAKQRVGEFLAALPANRHFFLIDGNCRANKLIDDPRAIRFSFIVDHPAYRLDDFANAKLGTLMGFVDESHLAAADRLGLPFPKIFFPHAGPPPDDAVIPLRERPIDVLIAGSLGETPSETEWRALHADWPAFMADPILAAADRLATSLTTCLAAWEEACAAHGVDAAAKLTSTQLAKALVSIERFATARRRRDVLAGLADYVKLHVFSPTTPSYLRDHPNVVAHGSAPFDEVQRACASAKVVINTVAKFGHGSHERIWYAMAKGCVVATDESRFMAQHFADGQSVLILPWGPEQRDFREHLADLLRQPQRLEQIQDAARPVYERHHSWHQRVLPLVDLMAQIDRHDGASVGGV